MITSSSSLTELAPALRRLRTTLKAATKSSTNAFESDYATLEDVWELIRLPLNRNKFSVAQDETVRRDGTACVAVVTTRLVHDSGDWIAGEAEAPITPTADAAAAEHTRLRRRGLCALLGIVQADTDGRSTTATADKAAELRAEIEARR